MFIEKISNNLVLCLGQFVDGNEFGFPIVCCKCYVFVVNKMTKACSIQARCNTLYQTEVFFDNSHDEALKYFIIMFRGCWFLYDGFDDSIVDFFQRHVQLLLVCYCIN